jgi:hypothetical protein
MIRCAWNQLELRLGGIYVLERSAQESGKDHWPIQGSSDHICSRARSYKKDNQDKKTEIISAPRADIQAILTVIGRRGRTFKKGEDERLYLFRTDLVKANLTFSHLEGQAGSRRMSSGPKVSSASLLGIYILLELGKKLRIVLSGDYRFFVLVSRDPSLVKRDQLLILCLGHDLPTLFLAVGAA